MVEIHRDDLQYESWQEAQLLTWEEARLRCGNCCGAQDDPCEHLSQDLAGVHYCRIYEGRFGDCVTVGGRKMRCVPIRDILDKVWPGDQNCVYKKMYKQGIK